MNTPQFSTRSRRRFRRASIYGLGLLMLVLLGSSLSWRPAEVSASRHLSVSAAKPAPIGPSCVAPPSGLVSWWPGDGNANDIQNGNNGIVEGSVTFPAGEVGQAFSFNGTDADVKVPAASTLNVGTANGLTIDAWINPTTLSQRSPLVEWNNAGTFGAHFWMSVTDVLPGGVVGNLYANLVDTNGNFNHTVQTTGAVLTANTWQHVALTYDKTNGNVAFYVNGVAVPASSSNLGVFTPQTSYDLYLANRPPGQAIAARYSGQMDEVELFNRVLSQTEIQNIFNAGSAGKCKPVCTPVPSGLVSWWPGDGNANDIQNGNNGTLQNGATFTTGLVGQAFHFDRTNSQFVQTTNASNLSFERTNAFSIDAWVRTTETAHNLFIASKETNSAPFVGYGIHISNGEVPACDAMNATPAGAGVIVGFLDVGDPSGVCPPPHRIAVRGTTKLNDGQWHHVAMTYDGSSTAAGMKLYVDGAAETSLVISDNLGSNSILNNTAFTIGSRENGGVPFNGDIDEVEVFNRALAQTEIQNIFNARSAGKCKCPFSLSPMRECFTPDLNSGSLVVMAPANCSWTAVSNDSFITINPGSGSGTGNGTVSYSVAANTSGGPRTGTLTISTQTFSVQQGVRFNDVPPSHQFYTFIGKLSARRITVGCGFGNFCPDNSVTREQMAAFIIRALGVFNPSTDVPQRFADVPKFLNNDPNQPNPFYGFIDQMGARGITSGCGGGNYCPGNPVTREQMAAFIIRALGIFNPSTDVPQRFADVPKFLNNDPNQPNPFYGFIDQMGALGITVGCGGGNYCPKDNVSRGQMAVFIIRAFGC